MIKKWHFSGGCLFCIAILLFAAGNSAWAETVSREAQKHMNRGMAAAEIAKSPAGYEEAIREFEQAVSLAPGWPAPYFNLGCVQKEVGKYQEALGSYRKYLELVPNAPDAEQVQTEIDQLEYKLEKILEVKQEEDRIKEKYKDVLGRWVSEEYVAWSKSPMSLNYEIRLRNGQLMVGVWGEYGEDINKERLVPAKFDGKILTFHFGSSSVPSDYLSEHGYNDWRELNYTIKFPSYGVPEGYYTRKYTDPGYHGFGNESKRVQRIRTEWKRWESVESDGQWWWDRSDMVPVTNP
jgi:tetratricopeptide (TPR) repeat protein